jgi:hypothetical protein
VTSRGARWPDRACGERGGRTQAWAFFVAECRRNLHVALCMSPVGAAFRERLRQNPSLVNCCTIDWFQAGPAPTCRVSHPAAAPSAHGHLGIVPVGPAVGASSLSACCFSTPIGTAPPEDARPDGAPVLDRPGPRMRCRPWRARRSSRRSWRKRSARRSSPSARTSTARRAPPAPWVGSGKLAAQRQFRSTATRGTCPPCTHPRRPAG